MALEKFVDALPIPTVIKPEKKINNIPFYRVTMKQFQQKLHRDLPPTTVWGYNGLYPGPTFEATRNQPIRVQWENELPFEHLLPIDRTVHGAEPDTPSVRTVVHLHGGRVRPESDGYPEAWFTRNFENVGPKFTNRVYEYPNCQRPTTLWYHDHAIGITRLNVYSGLAGLYIIRDKDEASLKLPSGKYEIPLLIQDRSFYPNGELFYPTQPGQEPPPAPQPPLDPTIPNPSVVPEFFGNTILVNGKIWPFLEVEPRKYRFRILNGSNSRFYRIALSSGGSFIQIGTEGGLLEHPVNLSSIIIAPAERADVIIDFSKNAGQSIILTNDAPAPFPDGTPPTADLSQIMMFRVRKHSFCPDICPDRSKIPTTLSCLNRINPNEASIVRKNTLIESTDEFGRLKLLLNNLEWNQLPLTETPKNGQIEIWELYNTTPDTHPIHLHLVMFQILNRATFTGDPNGPNLVVGPPQPPDQNELGWKDTVRANPGEVTRIIARFGPFTGIYPWHCHILEHEDNEMMRPYEVLNNPDFNPGKPILEQCKDESFAQCFDRKSSRHIAHDESDDY
ncbi:multicopper oxidase domain-containing protein [Bacillus sp. AGMB 02131]|uniref:Multicopper oxidase domain-containing protein n=1 Tax=Peribacillus faecalis TaxID=2772559 RepID=A0A927HBJ8_9BACI|nr:multicopper oxidase [Peribacillus faecalis]MBD3108667.1 multicopper oxidase domain-containing protein [Peribacillus faecalis]